VRSASLSVEDAEQGIRQSMNRGQLPDIWKFQPSRIAEPPELA
jgi:hypothetical protein